MNEDDLFWYEAEITRNEPCAGIGQNKPLDTDLKFSPASVRCLRRDLHRFFFLVRSCILLTKIGGLGQVQRVDGEAERFTQIKKA